MRAIDRELNCISGVALDGVLKGSEYGGREEQSTNLAVASCSGRLILARWSVGKCLRTLKDKKGGCDRK